MEFYDWSKNWFIYLKQYIIFSISLLDFWKIYEGYGVVAE